MKVDINGQVLELKRSFWTDLIYEDYFHKPIDYLNMNKREFVNLFSCCVIANQQEKGLDVMTKAEVEKWLQEQPFPDLIIGEFANWHVEQQRMYWELMAAQTNKETSKVESNKEVTTEKKD